MTKFDSNIFFYCSLHLSLTKFDSNIFFVLQFEFVSDEILTQTFCLCITIFALQFFISAVFKILKTAVFVSAEFKFLRLQFLCIQIFEDCSFCLC